MIVTVGNTKGGSGKTTIACQLALAWAAAGLDVLLVDADRQASAMLTIAQRAERTPAVTCAALVDGPLLRSQVKRQAPKFDRVVIDAGGRDSSALRAALVLSDLLLVPFQPRGLDVWALADMAELVMEARGVRDGLQARAVLNMADPGKSTDNAEAVEALTDPDLAAIELLDAPLRRRKAFASAMTLGLVVHELLPRDAKACAELDALAAAVEALLRRP